jgi:hypothetical protein
VPDGASLPLASSGGGGGGGKWALQGPEPLFLAFGFVDPHAPHEWPAAYVRHREMGEQERMRECEYDMDEQGEFVFVPGGGGGGVGARKERERHKRGSTYKQGRSEGTRARAMGCKAASILGA